MYLENILFITLFCFASGDVKRYDNYTLFQGVPETEEQLNFLLGLDKKYDVNFWSKPSIVNKTFDFTMRPEDIDAFMKDANDHNVKLNVLLKDIQRAFDEETVKTYIKRRSSSFDWTSYYRLREIYDWLIDVCYTNPLDTELLIIGKSIHGRDIVAVKLALQEPIKRTRSKVIIEAGTYGCEWISIAFTTYMFDKLLNAKYSNNEELKTVAFAYEWYFVPILNPDGYEYTHTKDRLWRKNRRGNYGVNLNRNFGVNFGTVGSSFNKSSNTYNGGLEFSEPETKAMAALVTENAEDLEYYITIHSYFQSIFLPFGHSKAHLSNYDEVRKMALKAAKAISKRNKTKYSVGTGFEITGQLISGSSYSWVKAVFEVPYTISLALPGKHKYGYAIPSKKILPICEETMDGVISFLTPRPRTLKKLRQQPISKDAAFKDVPSGMAIFCSVLIILTVL